MALLQAVERFGTPHNSWLVSMLERKPRMLVAVALAHKMACGLWAMMTKKEDYRSPAATMA
jgi:transposase